MKKARLLVCATLLAAFAVLAASCGAFQAGMQAGKDAVVMQQIGQTYRGYCTKNMKGPANVDDLLTAATTQDEKDAVGKIKDGKFTAEWNVNVNDPASGGSGALLVYSATANNGVRTVLMADCTTITALSEADFKAKPKAKATTGPVKMK